MDNASLKLVSDLVTKHEIFQSSDSESTSIPNSRFEKWIESYYYLGPGVYRVNVTTGTQSCDLHWTFKVTLYEKKVEQLDHYTHNF